MRYLPRPRGQRMRTWPTERVNSFKTVDLGERLGLLDLLAREERGGHVTTEAEARGGTDPDAVESTKGGEEVANGGEGALLLATVVNDLVLGSDGVGLEGQVVVGDLVTLAGDGLEDVVGGVPM